MATNSTTPSPAPAAAKSSGTRSSTGGTAAKSSSRRDKKLPPEVEAALGQLAEELTKTFGFKPSNGQVIGYLLRTRAQAEQASKPPTAPPTTAQ